MRPSSELDRLKDVQRAIIRLREARDFLAGAGAKRTLRRVRAALKSAEGAERNAAGRMYRERREVYAADRDPNADPRAAEIMRRLRAAAS